MKKGILISIVFLLALASVLLSFSRKNHQVENSSQFGSFQKVPTSNPSFDSSNPEILAQSKISASRSPASIERRPNRNIIPEKVINKLKLTDYAEGQNSGWKLAENVIAIPAKKSGKSNSRSILRIHNYELIPSEDSNLETFGSQVVFNPRRRAMGIISGVLALQLNPAANPTSFAAEYNLSISQFLPRINTIFIRTQGPAERSRIEKLLNSDSRIKSLEVEIIDNSNQRL